MEHAQIAVELKQPGCRSPRIGYAENLRTIAFEMILPAILSRMIQTNGSIGIWIEAKEIRSLVKIAVYTGEREIGLDTQPPMLAGHDVLDVKRRVSFITNLQTTVLAAMPRAFPH